MVLWKNRQNKYLVLGALFSVCFFSVASVFAVPPTSPYTSGSTLDPACTPGSTNCTVAITLSGTTNYIPKFTSGSSIGNSLIQDDGTHVTIGYPSGVFSATNDVLFLTHANSWNTLSVDPDGYTGLLIRNTNTTADTGSAIKFYSAGLSAESGIISRATSSDNSDISFYTENGGGRFTRLMITPAGNVGIGNTTPTISLQVGAGAALNIPTGASNSGLFNPQIGSYTTSGVAGIGVGVNDGTNNRRAGLFVDQTNSVWGLSSTYTTSGIPFVINNGITEQLRIDASGNVGIGTNSPQRKLHVTDTTTTPRTLLALENTNTTDNTGAVISFRGPTTNTGAASFIEYGAIRSEFSVHDNATHAGVLRFGVADGTGTAQLPNTFAMSILANGTLVLHDNDTLYGSGSEKKLFFDPTTGVFRAGTISNTNWDTSNLGTGSTAFGTNTIASGSYGMGWGTGTTASGSYATAWGINTVASNLYSTAWGYGATASNFESTAWGISSTASGVGTTAWGNATVASMIGGTAWGYGASTSVGNYGTAWGNYTTVTSDFGTAWGYQSSVTGQYATAWGSLSSASSDYATAFGKSTIASNQYATAWGQNATASGIRATAWGNGTVASGDRATAWGGATASGDVATAWGTGTVASGVQTTTWGQGTTASAIRATAWGYNTTASGDYSTAFGRENTAPSAYEVVTGLNTTTYTPSSTTTSVSTDRLFVIGNGGSTSTRADAFTILKNGHLAIGINNFEANDAGYLLQVGTSSTSGIVARFKNSNGTCDINPTTTSLVCSSDIRLKKNIQTLNHGLSVITALRPVLYNWNSESDTDQEHPGLVAQEVELVLPDLVTTDSLGYKSVAYTAFTPYMITAIQELDLKVTTLMDITNTSNPLLPALRSWFSATDNGITEFVADTIRARNQICIDDVCMSKEQLKQILQNQNTNSQNTQNTNGDTPTTPVESEQNDNPPPISPDTTTP